MPLDRVEYDRVPPQPERLKIAEWMRWHGIDPHDVAVPGWLERREDARQIAYASYEFNEDGVPVLNDTRDDAVRVVRVVQLEAVPSPFPGLWR